MDSEFLKKQEKACKDPYSAYYFAKNVEGADIKICQEFACKGPFSAYEFALHVPGADILDEYGMGSGISYLWTNCRNCRKG